MAVSRITITTPLSDDVFDRAAELMHIRPAIDALRKELGEASTVAHEIVTPPPRKAKGETAAKKKAAG